VKRLRLGIRAKLLISFISIALFAGMLGLYAVFALGRMNQAERTMYVDVFGGTHLLAAYVDESWGARSAMLNFLIGDGDQSGGITALRTSLAQTDQRLTELALQMDAADIDRADVQTLAAIQDAWAAYTRWRDGALGLVEAGDRAAALASYREEGQPLGRNLDTAIDAFIAHKGEVADQLAAVALATYELSLLFAVLLALGAVGLALFVGFLAARSIAGAAHQVATAARGLALGDLNQQVRVHSSDELGQMADAIRALIAYQQEMASVANAIARGDLNTNVQPKHQGDVLGTAFEWMLANLRRLVAQLEQAVQRANSLAEVAEEREARVQAILDSVADGIITLDDTGRIDSLNPAAERLFGYAEGDLVGQPGERLVPIGDLARAANTETMGRHRSGELFPIDMTVSRLERPGQCLSIISVRDATERKLAEERAEQLARSDKLRALGQMASGIAHDLNQSLALVAGYGEMARLALEREHNPPVAQEHLQTIIQAALDGGETVKRLLTFAHQRSEAPRERVDVRRVLGEVAQLTAPQWRDAAQVEGRRIDLQVDVEGTVVIDGWGHALREALTNLVLNAVDALPNGGEIRLSARREEGRATVAVSDTGTGMPPDVQARIFEPFFTTKGERGTGLGLAQTYGIVQQHGGVISVESQPLRGTTFRLSFPAAAPISLVEQPGPGPGEPSAPPMRILAIDDEPALARMVKLILSKQGHTVETATSGEAGLALLEAQRFDMVITDLGLGDGQTGWQVAEEVRRSWPSTRVVLATGWGAGIDPAEARERGVDAVLAKPYAPQDLRQLVSELARPTDQQP
jgi:PAS domain S-box-containing protein